MLGNAAYFDAFLGNPPEPRVCDTREELAEWFRLFAIALRVSRERRARAAERAFVVEHRAPFVVFVKLDGEIRNAHTTVRVVVHDEQDNVARKGRITPNVRR